MKKGKKMTNLPDDSRIHYYKWRDDHKKKMTFENIQFMNFDDIFEILKGNKR